MVCHTCGMKRSKKRGFVSLMVVIILGAAFTVFIVSVLNEVMETYFSSFSEAHKLSAYEGAETCQRFVLKRYVDDASGIVRLRNRMLYLDPDGILTCQIYLTDISGNSLHILTSGFYEKSVSNISAVYNVPDLSLAAFEST